MAMRVVYQISRGCVGCRCCIVVCPVHAIEFDNTGIRINEETCIGCGRCVEECQPEAIVRKEIAER
jgi:Na+-translocating ferredoxin:NAD+ oxidoreductase subunit B